MLFCFSLWLSHGYLPAAFIKTTIVPRVKNRSGNLSDSNNYRPIALATIVSKVLESDEKRQILKFMCQSIWL